MTGEPKVKPQDHHQPEQETEADDAPASDGPCNCGGWSPDCYCPDERGER